MRNWSRDGSGRGRAGDDSCDMRGCGCNSASTHTARASVGGPAGKLWKITIKGLSMHGWMEGAAGLVLRFQAGQSRYKAMLREGQMQVRGKGQ